MMLAVDGLECASGIGLTDDEAVENASKNIFINSGALNGECLKFSAIV